MYLVISLVCTSRRNHSPVVSAQIARISMRALRIAELAMFDMRQEGSPTPDDLYSALRDIVFRPVKTLAPPWSWKAAALSALLRGITFFVGNLRSGHRHALQAMMVEAVFCDFRRRTHRCSLTAITASQPVWEIAAIVCLGLPALMVVAQLGVHRAAHTPRWEWSHPSASQPLSRRSVGTRCAMGRCSVAPIAHHSYTTFAVCRA
jgi:hypothetical protein